MPDFLTKILNFFGIGNTNGKTSTSVKANSSKASIFNGSKKSHNQNEIALVKELSYEQMKLNEKRSHYISVIKNPTIKIKSGDSISDIAKKYGVDENILLNYNGLNSETVKKVQIGQIIKIPPARKIKNVKNLNDVAGSMGLSLKFIKDLKHAEDSGSIPDNKFHNTPYRDKAGVLTIGIGHVVKKGDKLKLTDAEVCELFAKDLLQVEEGLKGLLGSQKVYDRIPQGLKEALIDMTFNKGTAIIQKTPGLLYALKTGKYEAAVNKLTYNKSNKTGKEMSGLNKRRLFDISVAIKMYKGRIPQSNFSTMQQLYNRGITLLREECKQKGQDFNSQLVGYNHDVQSYLGNKVKFITK